MQLHIDIAFLSFDTDQHMAPEKPVKYFGPLSKFHFCGLGQSEQQLYVLYR